MTTEVTGQKMLIAGEWKEKDETIEVRDPGDNSLIDTVPAASANDMNEAIEWAKQEIDQKRRLPVHQRIEILNRAADNVNERKETFATIIAREGSKTINEARDEVDRTIQILRISAEEARRIQGETISFDQVPGSENRVGYYTYFPVGIVGAITAFNDPLNLVAHKVGPALASGNAVVVKPTSVTPLSALYLGEALLDAGLPSALLSVVTGKGSELGDPLVKHPDIRMVSFTGGLETGEQITQKSGVKKLRMELGSNSPVIVLNDADLESAVEKTVSGSFSAAGQNCIGVQRVFIEKDVVDTFTEQFVHETKQLTMGDKLSEDTDMGPMISEDEAKRIEQWVNEAVEEGAEILCGGERQGAYYTPTVLTNVPKHSKIACEEAFAPVVSLFSVEDLEEAIKQANDVNFGLQAGIFTPNIDKAHEAIEKLEVGGVIVNDSSDYRIDAMPFGGVKGSGIGREGVRFAIESMTEKKVACFNLAR
ncbi:aldehyde dehydrogenase family protein [Halobacillus naozhouensis]|uniref:Aldehyde dehydrogenase family protein n=1 Tax=Halobacillus naozhouensis TaxID=554880 RepID=A0ABY8IVK2_9BACI|nr:aldehyde dehydrogenase family protein [Halobacillus naozhouensis]WFT74208.1 aldehyde dehydrogenase family protein [Halobacillus naozhouensis]